MFELYDYLIDHTLALIVFLMFIGGFVGFAIDYFNFKNRKK